MNSKILVVEDEPSLSRLIEYHLKLVGFEVCCVYDGEAVFDAIKQFRPALITLDLMLPKLNGLEVCRKLRSQKNMTPIILLSALDDLSDKITGLDHGADDYMTKPFSSRELISRIQSILRRAKRFSAPEDPDPIEIGQLLIFPEQREIKLNGTFVELTPKEFELLLFLCNHRGKVMSRQQLLNAVWEYHILDDTRIVDVHISHLREKIERNSRSPEYIITIRNIGYKLKEPAISSTSRTT